MAVSAEWIRNTDSIETNSRRHKKLIIEMERLRIKILRNRIKNFIRVQQRRWLTTLVP